MTLSQTSYLALTTSPRIETCVHIVKDYSHVEIDVSCDHKVVINTSEHHPASVSEENMRN